MSADQTLPEGQTGPAVLESMSSALSTDFCPWANKYVYWMKNPFWVLVLAVAGSIACGIFLSPFVFLLTGLLLAVTGIGVALPWIAMRGISCRVIFDVPRSRVGQRTIVRLAVRNKWPFPVWGLSLIKGFAREESVDGNEGVALARVPGRATVEYSWPFEPIHRGLYPRDTAEIETGFPFGLFRAQKQVAVDGGLIVWPTTEDLVGMPDASESQQTEERFSERRVGEFGDMMGTRPFRAGDSLRRVHWAQTARQQSMIVTERQAPAMSSVRVVVDLNRAHYPAETREQAVELIVRVAASVCESLHRQHARIELLLNGSVLVAGDSLAGFHRVMDALAVADASDHVVTASSRRHGFEILVTGAAGMQAGHRHQIVIGDRSEHAWMNVATMDELATELPAQWKRACHVS